MFEIIESNVINGIDTMPASCTTIFRRYPVGQIKGRVWFYFKILIMLIIIVD